MILIYERRDFVDKITFWGQKNHFRRKTMSGNGGTIPAHRRLCCLKIFPFPLKVFPFSLIFFIIC